MMSLQNRVSPSGELLADNARGSWLGNRGILHNEKKEIIRPWKHENWVLCELNFKERKREVLAKIVTLNCFFLMRLPHCRQDIDLALRAEGKGLMSLNKHGVRLS
jgi:hypothetical protein